MKRLRPDVRQWLIFNAILSGIDGVVWLRYPSAVESGAYEWVRQVAPVAAWGAGFCVFGLLSVSALACDAKRWSAAFPLALFAMGGYGVACGTVGLSIFLLTLRGTTSALSGATKWWLICAITIGLFSRHSISAEEAE